METLFVDIATSNSHHSQFSRSLEFQKLYPGLSPLSLMNVASEEVGVHSEPLPLIAASMKHCVNTM